MFLPHLSGLVIEAVGADDGGLRVRARSGAEDAACGRCGEFSSRVHSRYGRRLADAAAGGRPVTLLLSVRRFYCDNGDCGAVTFAEQFGGLTSPRARRTPLLARLLASVGLALAGRAGARLAAELALPSSRAVLLRLVMALPDPDAGTVRVLGVDDFAFRRGRRYGTLLVDAETGRPVDLLPDRLADTLAAWLEDQPQVGVILRDRAGAYADGARRGAPGAVQVADRWHLYDNLCGHVARTVARHRGCLHDPEPEETASPGIPDLERAAAQAAARRAEDSGLAARTRQRYEQVQALKARNAPDRRIMRETGMTRNTVRRYRRAASAEELLAAARDGRPSVLDPHKPYLNQRWNQGCTSARLLHAELRDRGYAGGYETVRSYLQPFRALGAAPPPAAPPRTRDLARWITADPAALDDDEKAGLARARQRCPRLDALARHVTAFAVILTGLHGDRLDDWITAVEADDQPDLHSFTRGLRTDYDAARNGLTMTWNSGIVEGNVNRLKMLKRQTYGRAGFPLLRKRVLLAS